MKITVKRSGGFAGLVAESKPVVVDNLPPNIAAQIKQLVEKVQLFKLPADLAQDIVGADLARVEITVATKGRQHTVRFVADETPTASALQQLADLVLR